MPLKLDDLPLEVLFHILSYSSPFDARLLPEHPLVTVSATCRQLRETVEEYTRSLLKQHAKISPPKGGKRAVAFVCRTRWLKYVSNSCHFCGKKTVARAILDFKMPCCRSCDRKNFPKITMTDATQQHHLSKLDLFTPNALHPTLPPVTAGIYSVMGGDAVMVSTPDVLARKAHIASLLGAAKADNKAYMQSRVGKHNTATIFMSIHYHLRGDLNAMMWSHTFASYGKRTRRLPELPELSYGHETVIEHLQKQWAEMGMKIRIGPPNPLSCLDEEEASPLPSWVLEQMFGERCEAENCMCAALELLEGKEGQKDGGQTKEALNNI